MDTSPKSDAEDSGAERAPRRMRMLEEKLAIAYSADVGQAFRVMPAPYSGA